MDVRGPNGLIESLLAQKLLPQPRTDSVLPQKPPREASSARDIVKLSTNNNDEKNKGARLISETEEETENGIRLVQEFETAEGRPFTRIQEFSTTTRGFQRSVIQQNPSGSTTRLEEQLNRQDDGLFQRIQRFTNEIGETQTRIDNDHVSLDLFVVSGGTAYGQAPLDNTRGFNLDLHV